MNLSYCSPTRAPINNLCGSHSVSSRCSTTATVRNMCHEECYGFLHSGANSRNWKNRTENFRLIQKCCFLKKNGSQNMRLYGCTNAPGFDYRAALALSKVLSVGVSRNCTRSPAHGNEQLRGFCSRLWLRQSRTLKLRCDTTASTIASDANPTPAGRNFHNEIVCDAGTSDMEVRSDSDSSDSAKVSLLNWRSSETSFTAIPCTSAMRVEPYTQLRISADVKIAFSRHYRFSKEDWRLHSFNYLLSGNSRHSRALVNTGGGWMGEK